MAWAARKRRRRTIPDYGRPPRREMGFSQYVSTRKQANKTNKNNNNIA